MIKCKDEEDNITRMRTISSWSQRLKGGIQLTINTKEFRGEEKGSKKKNTSYGFYFLRTVASEKQSLVMGDFRNIEEEKVLKGHWKEWNRELIRGK